VQPDQPRQPVLAAADRQRPQVYPIGDRQGGDDGGQGVTADELQDNGAGPGRADPAQHRAEPAGQVVRPVGEVDDTLPGDQPDRYPVDMPGRGDLDQHRQDDPAPVEGSQVGDGHHRRPAAPVDPGPPGAPRGCGHPPGEPGRPVAPPDHQDQHGPGGHSGQADPADGEPQERQQAQRRGGDRVAEGQPGQPEQEPGQPGEEDDSGRGLVDRGAEDGAGEGVGVVDLGDLFAGHDAAHTMITSSMNVSGENPGAAGGTSSSRPATVTRAITPPARPAHPGQRSRRGPGRRECPARPRTGSPPRPAGGRRSRHPR